MVLLTWVATGVLTAAYAWAILAWPQRWIRLVVGAAFAAFWFAVFLAGYMDMIWSTVTPLVFMAGALWILLDRSKGR